MKIAREQVPRHAVRAIRDKEGRQHVYRIVKMSEKDDDTEHDGKRHEYVAQPLFIPKQHGKEKGQPCMTGKERVFAEKKGGIQL